jgi:choline dehydrogenase-like flavoprotein
VEYGAYFLESLLTSVATNVLIIEAGNLYVIRFDWKFAGLYVTLTLDFSDKNEDFITIPVLSTANIPVLGNGAKGTQYDWNMTGVPQAELHNRSIGAPSGKIIGGGTVLNGMVFNRGSRADYDRWEKLGNPGWNFDTLLPYFKKAGHFTPPDKGLAELWDIEYQPEFHGETGFVQSSFPPFVWPSTSRKSSVSIARILLIRYREFSRCYAGARCAYSKGFYGGNRYRSFLVYNVPRSKSRDPIHFAGLLHTK